MGSGGLSVDAMAIGCLGAERCHGGGRILALSPHARFVGGGRILAPRPACTRGRICQGGEEKLVKALSLQEPVSGQIQYTPVVL